MFPTHNTTWEHSRIIVVTGDLGNIKMSYRNTYCGDKTNLALFYLQNVISFTGKTASLYRIRTLVTFKAPDHQQQLWEQQFPYTQACQV